jgi:hypothetical protein|tara:strand:- start:513 stop:887 length:375 start_codon:yes stop_codon:yes gene_type:complete
MIQALIAPVAGLLDKFIEDKDTKNKIAFEISTMADKHAQELALAQIGVNREEAKGNWFQSSWRPATGWVCVLGLLTNFLVSPILAGFNVTIPQADASVMMPLLLGLLGLAGARSFDKIKKVDSK